MTGSEVAASPITSPIADPWHSRPIDVHRWSDHPEALRLAEALWGDHFKDFAGEVRRRGPKPKTSYRNQLKVVILDLYVAWLTDPELSIGLPMSSNGWDGNSRYNALHLTRKITELVTRLQEVGLIDLSQGSYSGPLAASNRNTRIRAAGPLIALFRDARLRRSDIRQFEGQECIILKDSDDAEGDARAVPYEDTAETRGMRTWLRTYNALLQRTFIDIPTAEEDYVERVDQGGRVVRVPTAASATFVRRIFSRGSWELNGRLYGGWWQQVGKDKRKQIFINDVPTVEVDFKGMHVSMLSLEKGVPVEGDLYELPDGLVPGLPKAAQRTLVKQLVLTAINARNRRSAFAAFREGAPAGHMAKALTNPELERILVAFLQKHPHLEDSMCSDQGIRLMYLDSRIAVRVINHFLADHLPVLCIHDSFIVPYDQVSRLKTAMSDASQTVLGQPLLVEATNVGLDEVTDWPRYVVLDYVLWRQTARCPGYLRRLKEHETG